MGGLPEFDYAVDLGELQDDEKLILALDAWEGPIDALLHLAREQKVDLANISIVQLVDQYIMFVRKAHGLRIELAADYLVMAAWLAFLKSKLLLPKAEKEQASDGPRIARDLAFHLKRLDAMRGAGEALFERSLLGQGRFSTGGGQRVKILERISHYTTLAELLKAYGRVNVQEVKASFSIKRTEIFSLEAAFERLQSLVQDPILNWLSLHEFLPSDLKGATMTRSGVASTFVASLELARLGKLDLKQDEPFADIKLRSPKEARGALL